MAAPSNAPAPAAYSTTGYEPYYPDPFWTTGQAPVGYGLPPLTELSSTTAPPSGSSYDAAYYMPAYYPMAPMGAYDSAAALAAAAAASSSSAAGSYQELGAAAAAAPPTTTSGQQQLQPPQLQQLNSFYMPQPPPTSAPVSSSMMPTPTYPMPVAMPNQISPPPGAYDFMGYGSSTGPASCVAVGMGMSCSAGQLTAGAAPAAGAAAAPPKKKAATAKKVKTEAPLSIRSHGDSEDFDENEEEDHDRRKLNNIRERVRVKDINNAFTELGDMVSQFDSSGVKMEKAQTKLGILHNAVELIKILEDQVKQRNLARNMTAGVQKPYTNC